MHGCPTPRAGSRRAEGTRGPERSRSFVFELFEMMDVEAVERLANLEEEDAENERRHEDIQADPELDYHRHAVGRAGRSKEQPVLHGEEADYLRDGLTARDHHQE